MSQASAAEVAAMDKAIAEVRGQYARAQVQVDANTTGFFVSDEATQVRSAFLSLGPLIETWATTYRTWAVAGQRDDGTAYDANRFLQYGQGDLADAVQKISGEAYDRSLFAALAATVKQTADDLKPTNWPVGLQVGAGVVVLVVLVVAVALVARR